MEKKKNDLHAAKEHFLLLPSTFPLIGLTTKAQAFCQKSARVGPSWMEIENALQIVQGVE